MIYISIIFAVIMIIIINKINERHIINIVLSRLDFYPKHYKIIRKNKKIYIKYHYLIDNKYIYNDETFRKNSNVILNGGLKLVDIIINFRTKEYKIILSAFHIINTDLNYYQEITDKINNNLYYFNNNIIDEELNIDYNAVKLNNYNYTEPNKYDKYICRNYSIVLTNDNEFIYLNSLSNNIYNAISLSNEIRIKEIISYFI